MDKRCGIAVGYSGRGTLNIGDDVGQILLAGLCYVYPVAYIKEVVNFLA